jgi:tetratricopeptide (TPR) repeat protein
VISSHQIDRYEAIRELQEAVKANPNDVTNWVILGELANEVALDMPPNQAGEYYRMSREGYEKALALQPNNAGLQAAVQFAKEQESGAAQLEQSRRQAARTYIEARRRDLAETGNAPTLPVYSAPTTAAMPSSVGSQPVPGQPVQPGQVLQPGQVTQPGQPIRPGQPIQPSPYAATTPSNAYSYPMYQPYMTYQGQPLNYQQYVRSYYPPTYQTGRPMTLQRFFRQMRRGGAAPVMVQPVP